MLQINGLSKAYDSKSKALNNVNLQITNGLFGLLGPNGAGKSSLMRTIATLQTPDQGEILFNGENILDKPDYMRSRLGYLPQEYGVYPGISANDLMHYLGSLKGLSHKQQRQQQIDALLDQVNLYQHKHKAVSQFSGGMKQRFGIAQALLADPSIIIVDEPTAGLDPMERNRFHNLLAEISDNKIVILSTHIVEDVNNLCQQMAILAGGKIVRHGNPIDLQQQLDGKVWRIQTSKQNSKEMSAEFDVLSQRMVAGQTVLHVLNDNSPGKGFEAISPDLEDTYFSALAVSN